MAEPAKKDTKNVARRVSENLGLELYAVNRVISLLDQENTVPFIARYRKEQTGGLEPTELRKIQVQCEEQRALITRAENVEKKIGEKITPEIKSSLISAKTLDEIEDIYAPFKKGSQGTLANRARQLGLGEPAEQLLQKKHIDLKKWINPEINGLKKLKNVTKGVQHILADIISKDPETLEKFRKLTEETPLVLECQLTRAAAKQKQENEGDKRFEQYHNFKSSISYLRSHQVLAINRGEQTKVLSVKLSVPVSVTQQFLHWCKDHWVPKSVTGDSKNLFQDSVDDAYNRLMEPAICRQARAKLTKKAQRESTDIFGKNLLRLLLTPPLRGKFVLSIDPGFLHGCKVAMLSPVGEVLETRVMHPFGKKGNIKKAQEIMTYLVHKHKCETIAIGNGVGCRETETLISQMIKENAFRPLDVVYCIVSEDGASVYSASELAIAELPDLDTSLRGAVSIGRRLQDPLVELVKIEPKHMGIGMYQHDIPETLLKGALNGIVEDCVSFVGVDLNVAGVSMLRKIAGLNETRAKAIVAWREENGEFINRQQLRNVRGIGQKTYEQCAGFMRIMACHRESEEQEQSSASDEKEKFVKAGSKREAKEKTTSGGKRKKKSEPVLSPNFLDMTCIHPESYGVAERFMELVGACAKDIGRPEMKRAVTSALRSEAIESYASRLDVGVPTMELIADGLRQPTDYDLRASLDKPLFKRGLTALEDLRPGMQLTGRVSNLTSFGAFVDCGVGRDGLIHNSKMGSSGKEIGLGDTVEVIVEKVDLSKGHLSLRLTSLRSRLDPQILTSSPFKDLKRSSLSAAERKNEGSSIVPPIKFD